MKKVMYSIAIMTSVILSSCGGENKTEEHNHESHDHSSGRDNEIEETIIPSNSSSFIDAYLLVKKGLVSDDAEATAKASLILIGSLGNVKREGLSKEEEKEVNEIIESIKENAEHIANNASEISHQREHLVMLSRDVKDLIAITGTDKKLYQDFCPMYKEEGAMWLSDKKEIENPYYGATMLNCGSIEEEINN